MDEDNLKTIIGGLTNKLEQLESQLKDLQSQQLETGQQYSYSDTTCRDYE